MNWKPVEDLLQEFVARGVPGCEMTVMRRGEVLFHGCAGYSDEERTVPASENDRYLMYSCTKMITAACAMKLRELGLLDLDDPVEKYLPAYAGKGMTIRHLMTMTGGMDYDLNAPEIQNALRKNPAATTREIADALAEKALHFLPGEKWLYSLCHDVLGAAMEVAAGKSLGECFRESIFEPAGMTRTEFWSPEKEYSDIALQMWFDEETKALRVHPRVPEFCFSSRYESGGAGLVSCVSDYARFADAMVTGKLLSEESIGLLRTDEMAKLGVTNFGCSAGPDYTYGLGVRVRVRAQDDKKYAMGEFGWDGAAGSDVLMDPDSGISIVYGQHVRKAQAMMPEYHGEIRDRVYGVIFG